MAAATCPPSNGSSGTKLNSATKRLTEPSTVNRLASLAAGLDLVRRGDLPRRSTCADDRHRSVDVSGLAGHQVVGGVEDLHREIDECDDGLLGHLPHVADDGDWPTALPGDLGFNTKEPRGDSLRRVVPVRYASDHGIDRLEVERWPPRSTVSNAG